MSQSADTADADADADGDGDADADEDVDVVLCWNHFIFHVLPPLLMNNAKSM